MTELVLVKLGGSLITDKGAAAVPRLDVLERLSREIAQARPQMPERLLVGHGSGSFGHVAAAKHGIGSGQLGPSSGFGISETRAAAAQLHQLVTEQFLGAGLKPFSWAPSSALISRAGRPVSGEVGPLVSALALDLMPVVYGDVVMDRQWGASICSTEATLQYLVGRLQRRGLVVRRVLWLGATDGIYGRDGQAIPIVHRSNHRQVRKAIGATAGTDVTGGMLLRLETARWLAHRGVESWIVNGLTPELLTAGLLGEKLPGTCYLAETNR
ncbi:MAG: isopentenyl phosphate kinase [Acidobacteriota bacterium]